MSISFSNMSKLVQTQYVKTWRNTLKLSKWYMKCFALTTTKLFLGPLWQASGQKSKTSNHRIPKIVLSCSKLLYRTVAWSKYVNLGIFTFLFHKSRIAIYKPLTDWLSPKECCEFKNHFNPVSQPHMRRSFKTTLDKRPLLSSLLGMVIWVVNFPREGYKIPYIFCKKST